MANDSSKMRKVGRGSRKPSAKNQIFRTRTNAINRLRKQVERHPNDLPARVHLDFVIRNR